MFAPLQSPSVPLDGEWRLKTAHEGQGLEYGYADPALDDSGWDSVRLPHLRHATVEQDTLWYRCRFSAPTPNPSPIAEQHSDRGGGRRFILRFGGAFYRTRVWLNGVDLGNHEGYFQPFGFDVTDRLKSEGNVLAVRCRFPVEAGAFKRKTAVAGIFTDWDCKPYPSAFYPDLPAPNQWTVPIGLWQPVSLQTTGPVLIESLNVFPNVVNPNWGEGVADCAELRVVAMVRNLTAEAQTASVSVEVSPHTGSDHNVIPSAEGAQHDRAGGEAKARGEWQVSLDGGERRDCEFNLTLPRPRLWFPWTHGSPNLYAAKVILEIQPSNLQSPISNCQQVFGVRDIRASIEPGQWEWSLNGRRIFPRGSNYISDFYLDRVTPEGLQRDIELAKNANLDLLRIHAHIAPAGFYRLCDELGVMVMCDFPLIWTYAFELPPDEDAAFHDTVRTQVEDMVRLLGSHPGIILWSMHNEPPWTPDGSFLGSDVHQSATNQQMDENSAACARALDPTRPVIPASGVYDQHLYHGWYTGGWRDNGELHPPFPTEFGVQALPNLDSPFWATVNSNWPVDADDASWAHSGYQSVFWAGPGVGAPSQFSTLTEYVTESQAYQAFFIRYAIDQWRRQKFDPVGGYIHFLLTDGWPAITWSVIDYYRLPKAGYNMLAEVSRPAHVCIDLSEGFAVEHGFHLVFAEGSKLKAGLWLVNDDYRLSGDVEVRWWIERRGGGRLARRLHRALGWMSSQRIPARLPNADERALLLRSLEIPLNKPGEFTFRVQLWWRSQRLDENFVDFRVGEARAHHKAPRRVPGLLVNKVYQVGSLRRTEDGFMFSLKNPAMPVFLQHVADVRVDGQMVEASQVEFVSGGVARRATTITPHTTMEIPSNAPFTAVVRGHPLAPGGHEIEMTVQFLGLGEVSVRLKDKLI